MSIEIPNSINLSEMNNNQVSSGDNGTSQINALEVVSERYRRSAI